MSEYSNELIEKLKKAQNVEEVAELLKTYCQNEAEAKGENEIFACRRTGTLSGGICNSSRRW